ncbi:MAG: gamma carbonic anhydrase family protein [Rhizobiaceae bacterium]|nr:gamma carbonic anhydrase family protein [Rhizobiaceae bacterium]
MKPIVLPYGGVEPEFATPPAYAASGSAVLGRAKIGRSAWLGERSVIRADGHFVEIGDDFRLGAGGTVHISHDLLPTRIGHRVTAGTNSVIHACNVGDDCFIGDDVVILDGSEVENGCAIEAGSVVFPRSSLQTGWLYGGSPVAKIRELRDGELGELHSRQRSTPDRSTDTAQTTPDLRAGGHVFVATSARLAGQIDCEGENGIWYGCVLDAGKRSISVGLHTNIQDNTTIRSIGADVRIGRNATIGHNVTMDDCTVGDASLIGIGATLAPGTLVESDVLVAAGAATEAGQKLDTGWLYAGSPARKLRPLEDKHRALIAGTWPVYCEYALRFARAQEKASI